MREPLSSSAVDIIMCFYEFFFCVYIFHPLFFLFFFSSISFSTVLCSSPALCSVKGGDGEFHLVPSPGHSVLLLYLSSPSPRIMHISQGAMQCSASLSRDSEVGVLFLIEVRKKMKIKARHLLCLMESPRVRLRVFRILWDLIFLFVSLCHSCELLSS